MDNEIINFNFSYTFMGHTKQNLHIMIIWNNLTHPPPHTHTHTHTHMHLYNTHAYSHMARYQKEMEEMGRCC